jgi:hypothetical protein
MDAEICNRYFNDDFLKNNLKTYSVGHFEEHSDEKS